MIFLVSPGKCWDSTLKQTMSASFHLVISDLSLHNLWN